MAKIILNTTEMPHNVVIDTNAMNVELREVFLGVSFVTEQGEKLSVSMRDNGFEIHYTGDFGETGFDAGLTEFKGGNIKTVDVL